MKNIHCAIVLLFFVVLSNSCAAASDLVQQLQQNLVASQDEVKLLKAQLAVVQAYQDKFLATVYWSLGTLASIAALLVGFGWFANFKIFERDKLLLRQELSSGVDQELQRLRQVVESQIEESKKALEEKISKETGAGIKPLDRRISALENEISRAIGAVELELRKTEHKEWRDKKVFVNALRTARQILEISLKTANKYAIADALDLLQDDLRPMLKSEHSGSIPDADDIRRIVNSLEVVGAEHVISVDSIREMLAKVRTIERPTS